MDKPISLLNWVDANENRKDIYKRELVSISVHCIVYCVAHLPVSLFFIQLPIRRPAR